MKDGSTKSALSKLPTVVNHGPDGLVRWRLRLTDFVVGRELEEICAKARRSIGLDPQKPTSSYTFRIAPFGEKHAVVQVGLRTARSLRQRV